ncbi:GspD family T2SS secretin variant LspD [Opitutaceae bacterium]
MQPPRNHAFRMILRLLRLGLVALTLASVDVRLPAQPGSPSIEAVDSELVGPFRMPDAPLDAVLQLLELYSGRSVLRPAALPATTYNFVTRAPIPKAEAILALETLLNLNQIGIAPLGDKFIKVVPIASLRAESPDLIEGSALDLPPSGRVASKVFTFQFVRVREFLPEIVPLLNPQLGGPLLFEKSNAALITDTISTLQRVELLVRQLDKPATAGLTPQFYTLQFAKASDLVSKINTALGTALKAQLGSATTISADDRTNQVVLIGDPSLHGWFGDLVAKLDVKADPNTRNEVIPLKHANATLVAPVVSQLVSGQTQAATRAAAASIRPGQGIVAAQGGGTVGNITTNPAAPSAGAPTSPAASAPTIEVFTGDGSSRSSEFSSLVTILADERSNALIVSGTVDDIRLIRELVDKIDVVLPQVRIEVVIAEVTLEDNDTSGIEALGLLVRNSRLIGVSGSGPGFAITGLPSDSAAGTDFATLLGSGALGGTIGLTSNLIKDKTNILSAPSILTAHNTEGSIFVGEERPTISGYTTDATTTTGTRTSVTQTPIGITLTAKPLIGNDGSVQLTIEQEVKDILGEIEIDGNAQPRVGSRTTSSFVTVKSGDIIVLGGLQRNFDRRARSRLGPLPLVGDLFGSRTKANSRTDLVFFLRPIVLTNTPEDNAEAQRRIDALPNANAVRQTLDPTTTPPPANAPVTRVSPRRP